MAEALNVPDKRVVKMNRVRLSFTDSLKTKSRPKGVEDGKEKYNCNIIIPRDHPKFAEYVKACVAAIEESCAQQWGKPEAWKAIQEDNPKRVGFKKGERFKNDDGEIYDGYEGNYAFGATGPKGGDERPKMLDRHKRPVDEKDITDVFYSGCYADVVISFFATDKGGRGVFVQVNGIRSHQEGDRLAGGGITVTADMFDDLEDDNAFDDDKPATGGAAASDDFDIG